MSLIYKIVPCALWQDAECTGTFVGAPIDVADGFIHFSNAEQVEETASRHFAGQRDLLLVAAEVSRLGDALRWEVSRGGALFPHLYEPLQMGDVAWTRPLPDEQDGHRDFGDILR